MAYNKNTWVDRNVQYPQRYNLSLVSGTTYDISATPGTVTAAGTAITASNMNNLENAMDAVHKGTHVYGASSTTNDAYAITLSPALTAYNTGLVINFKADVSNTGAATLNVNGLGAKTIKKNVSADLSDGDIQANQIVSVVYDGTNFQMLAIDFLRGYLQAQGDIIYASAANSPARLAKGTAGQILAMNSGATAPQWQTNSLVEIASTTVGAGGAANITFSSIPSTYRQIILFLTAKSTDTTQITANIQCVINSDTASNYFSTNSFNQVTTKTAFCNLGWVPTAKTNNPTIIASSIEVVFPHYSDANSYKVVHSRGGYQSYGAQMQFDPIYQTCNNASITAAISSIALTLGAGNFAQNSRAVLYGVL